MKLTKTFLFLLAIFLIALVLRLLAAYYTDIGTDEMIYTVLPLNIISAGRLSTVEQAPLYFYLVDIGYTLTGGLSLVSGRLPSIIFGSFAIFIIFLISQELFKNKSASLLSAFFFAISGYGLRWNQEMDMTAFFFSLFSVYFLIKGMKSGLTEKPAYLYTSIAFLALAVLVKPIVLLFAPAYILIIVWHGWEHQNGIIFYHEGKVSLNKKLLKITFFSLVLALILVSPVLIYNYLLYQDTGRTDYYFTTLAGIGSSELYAGQEAESWSFTRLLGVGKETTANLFRLDALLFLSGLVGMVFAFRKDKYNAGLFLSSIVFLFFFIAGRMGAANHFMWIPLVLSIFAGEGAWKIKEFVSTTFKFKQVLIVLIIFSLLFPLLTIKQLLPQKEKSIAIALEEYARENIPEDALVVIDPRIYRGILAWSFNQGHYLEGTYFPQVLTSLNHLPGEKQLLPLYYIECGPGTFCGWKPEDFQRIYNFSEELSSVFHQQTQKIAEIKAVDTFIIYRGSISAPASIYEVVDRTHSFWYTPVGWKYTEKAIDNYHPDTSGEKILNSFGFFILYLEIGIALLSVLLLFFLLGKLSD